MSVLLFRCVRGASVGMLGAAAYPQIGALALVLAILWVVATFAIDSEGRRA